VTPIGLEGDLHAYRMTDQHCPIDGSVVENARDIVGEILDCHAVRVAWRRGTAVPSIMRV